MKVRDGIKLGWAETGWCPRRGVETGDQEGPGRFRAGIIAPRGSWIRVLVGRRSRLILLVDDLTTVTNAGFHGSQDILNNLESPGSAQLDDDDLMLDVDLPEDGRHGQ